MNMSEDFCPMCNGSGKHDLRPPEGKIYILVEGVSQEEWMPPSDQDLFAAINEAAKLGYELVEIISHPTRESARAVMKWRWP